MATNSKAPKLGRVKDGILRVCNRLVGKETPFWYRFATLTAIKYLYMILTVVVLTHHGYVGTRDYGVDFTFWKEIFGTAVFLPLTYLYLKLPIPNRFVRLLMHFLFIVYYIPINSAFSLCDTSFGYFFLSNIYFILLLLTAITLCLLPKLRRDNRLKPQKQPAVSPALCFNVQLFCAAICVLFIIHKLLYNGLSFSLSLESGDVYGNRSEYQIYLESIAGTPWSYCLIILRNLATFVVPFYLLTSLINKRPRSAILAVLCILSMFSVSSDKSKLFLVAAVVFLFLCYKLQLIDRFDRLLEVCMLLLMAVCTLSVIVRGSSSLFMLLVRREMYIPSLMNTLYYDYFSEHAKIFWSQDTFLLQDIIPSAYASSPLHIINAQYFEGLIASPNTGMFAEAYMHFGALGVIVYPALLGGLFLFFDKTYAPYGKVTSVLLAVQITLRLTNVPILRNDSVFSVILFSFMLWVLPKIPSFEPLFCKIGKLFKRNPTANR